MQKFVKSLLLHLIIFSGLCGYARADGTWVNCVRTSGYYQYFSSTTIQVGKDAQVGDVLGGWLTSSNPSAWTCSHRNDYLNNTVAMNAEANPPYITVGSTVVDGQSYTIYTTAVKEGLGYIARWRYSIKGQYSDWYPLTGTVAGVYERPGSSMDVSYDVSNSSWYMGLDVQVRFVKTSNTLNAGTNLAIFDPIYVRHYQSYGSSYSRGTGTYMIAQFQSGGFNISTTGGTCTTSDVTVELPSVGRSEFTGIGHTAARTDFELLFTKCPSGLASISYLFTPTTSIVDNTSGIFALNSSSTASGVGLQLLTNDDVPLSFNTSYLLSDYDMTQNNANYSVPLRAGLYQTDNSVSSGSVAGSVTFTLSYK